MDKEQAVDDVGLGVLLHRTTNLGICLSPRLGGQGSASKCSRDWNESFFPAIPIDAF